MECQSQGGQEASRRVEPDPEGDLPRGNSGQPAIRHEELVLALFKTVRHFFPGFNLSLDQLPDPRDPQRIVYPLRALCWDIVLMFLFQLQARRRVRFEFNSMYGLANLNKLAKTDLETLPHPDTLVYPFRVRCYEAVAAVRTELVRRLVRNRVLEQFRLLGRYYLVAVDGTGILCFSNRHCPNCLTKQLQNGQILYYHNVLEAKLICSNGLAISVATEFIDNTAGDSKQDCETKAFHRLVPRLRQAFPGLPICLLLDGLYLNQSVLSTLEKHRLAYIITFKQGSLPNAYEDYQGLLRLCSQNVVAESDGSINRRYRWILDLSHEGHSFNAFECLETSASRQTRFVWATNIDVSNSNVSKLSQKGGRCRWKIENEGFNAQKNGGFGLEHAYSENFNVAKSFYFFLQIAHLFFQLLCLGRLLGKLPTRLFGSRRAFSSRLLEAWRNATLDDSTLHQALNANFQIRLNSS